MKGKSVCEYQPIDDEMLWGVPEDELPPPDPSRNYFDEQQAIDELFGGECGCFILTD